MKVCRARRVGVARALAALCAAALLAALAACSSAGSATGDDAAYRGDPLDPPINLPTTAALFRSTAGGTTTLADLQRGHLMLLFFGYTHCPDVCPTTMADLGQALRKMPADVQNRIQVVFVTSDPARDTVPVMKAWLGNFDANLAHHFVGLTASIRQIDAVATEVRVPLSPPSKAPNGTITVDHGAQTLAFVDGKASLLWTAATSPADYGHDIGELVRKVPA